MLDKVMWQLYPRISNNLNLDCRTTGLKQRDKMELIAAAYKSNRLVKNNRADNVFVFLQARIGCFQPNGLPKSKEGGTHNDGIKGALAQWGLQEACFA